MPGRQSNSYKISVFVNENLFYNVFSGTTITDTSGNIITLPASNSVFYSSDLSQSCFSYTETLISGNLMSMNPTIITNTKTSTYFTSLSLLLKMQTFTVIDVNESLLTSFSSWCTKPTILLDS